MAVTLRENRAPRDQPGPMTSVLEGAARTARESAAADDAPVLDPAASADGHRHFAGPWWGAAAAGALILVVLLMRLGRRRRRERAAGVQRLRELTRRDFSPRY